MVMSESGQMGLPATIITPTIGMTSCTLLPAKISQGFHQRSRAAVRHVKQFSQSHLKPVLAWSTLWPQFSHIEYSSSFVIRRN